MSIHECCTATEHDSRREAVGTVTTDGGRQSVTCVRRCLNLGKWLVPSVILVLLPKCPACLAAYIVIGTGVGVSLSTAHTVQMLLTILCMASLSYLAARHRHRVFALILQPKGVQR